MVSRLNKDNRGFTIIEVLIVLAIAGLIMLIVFLAIPALQRNQRNNARNSEASRISSAISECLANRNSVIASCTDDANWNVGTLQQLSTVDATATRPSDGVGTGSTTQVAVSFGARCTADGSNDEAGSARDYVVMYQLEPAVNRCIGSQSS